MDILKNKFHFISLILSILLLILDLRIRDSKGYIFGLGIFILLIIFFLNFYFISNQLSVYFKNNNHHLYNKYAGRKYIFKDLRSVEFFRITKLDLLTIPDEIRIEIIESRKRLLFVVLVIFFFVFFFMLDRFLFKI